LGDSDFNREFKEPVQIFTIPGRTKLGKDPAKKLTKFTLRGSGLKYNTGGNDLKIFSVRSHETGELSGVDLVDWGGE